MKAHQTEKGQALVLIVLAIVAMLGFAALAVDFGRVFSERRRMQSVADTAAFAAASKAALASQKHQSISEAQLLTEVLNKAKENGAVPEAGTDPNLPRVEVAYHHPPVSGPYMNNNQYYQVQVTTDVDQIFSQFVFTGKQRLTVEAVARSRPVQAIFPGNAMHATSQDECKAVWFDGGGNTVITGGNVFSNSGATGNCASGQQNGSGSVLVNGGGILVAGTWTTVGNSGSVSPAPDENVSHQDMPDIATPDCSSHTEQTISGNNLQPGKYSSGISIQNDTWTMAPGMYCLYGNFRVNGGTLSGNGVMIVMYDGDIDFAGNATINLKRPNDLVDDAGQHWGGMLFFMPESNHGGIDLSGGSGTQYTGTIFAPGPRDASKPKCTVGGNSGSIGVNANLVCNTIQVHGGANVSITYEEQANYRMPPIVELAQ